MGKKRYIPVRIGSRVGSKLVEKLGIRERADKIGLPPGALVHTGEKKDDKVKITVFDYDAKGYEEKVAKSVRAVFHYKKTPSVSWINIDGIHDVEIVKTIGKKFDIHPLILEDILNPYQRPKVEDQDYYIFIVLKMLQYNSESAEIKSEQVSIIVGKNFVISFQETAGWDVFDSVRERIRKGRLCDTGTDYLAYALIDAVVDNYFLILEGIGEKIEDLEEELIGNPTQGTLHKIYGLKKEMIHLRKSVWPLREVISSLGRSESKLIQSKTYIYLRDVYDHTIQVIDAVETFRDMIAGMIEIYLSSISNRLNEVMKVLTIFSTIFIPLTFIVGIYGMNFRYMPELEMPLGYYTLMAFMGVVSFLMLTYFRRKRWL